ncbi:MAG: hypothetical protein PHD74_08900 [Candidatus Krumholzibacteria bacterium]|nr:hypothetical protein [Candidatus Krumholzibacteria bacterium]
MRKMITIAATMIAIFVLASPSVMAGNGKGTGEGNFFKNFYQWLRDDDGDGIPNCIDPDYTRPEDGTGYGKLGPSLSAVQDGDRDQIRDRDQLKDGSCNETCVGNALKLSHEWAGSKK